MLQTHISIILPTYNMADLLSEAIQSVVAQSYNNWELIIVDNNSTDHTTEVIKKYEDIRIKTIKINN